MAARCQFAHSCELATTNWQPDANSISEDFRQFGVIRKPANASQLATGSQMPIRFQGIKDNFRLIGNQ